MRFFNVLLRAFKEVAEEIRRNGDDRFSWGERRYEGEIRGIVRARNPWSNMEFEPAREWCFETVAPNTGGL